MSKLKTLIKSKYFTLIILILILLIGSFFRFYKIREYMTFLGDEGRDVLVVKRMIVDHKFTLLGPITSVGSMYMGPIYYYFMAPFLWIWRLDPVGPSIMVALLSLSTIFLIYKIGKDFFCTPIGLIAAFLYSISPLTISYGKSSWNPNIVPLFSLLVIYALLQVIVKKNHWWFLVAGLSLGILLQLHYVTFMFILIIPSCLLLIRFRLKLKYYLAFLLAFVFTYSPFLLFELRHKLVNLSAVWRFIWTQKESHQVPLVMTVMNTVVDVFYRLFWRLVIIQSAELTKVFLLFLIIVMFLYLKKLKNKSQRMTLKIIFIWIGGGTLSYGLYRGVIYDYYLGSLFAAPFILTGIFLYYIYTRINFGKIISSVIILLLIIFNLQKSPLRIEPNNMVGNTETISRFIYNKVGNSPYNFALIAGRNSDHAYRYFLEIWGNPPQDIENPDIDPARNTVTQKLAVVCEEKICQPLGHPLWEIAGFGRAEIKGEWDVVTTKVFLLTHYQPEKNILR